MSALKRVLHRILGHPVGPQGVHNTPKGYRCVCGMKWED
jgi:hypothetical protein